MRSGDSKLSLPFVGSPALARLRVLPVALSVVGCCLLVSLAAQVRIPIPGTEVPITLQVLAVLLTGFALRPSQSVAAILLYLACGAAGLPVFAHGSAGLAGSTGGYLAGFAVAAWLVSSLKGASDAGFGRLLAAGAVGTLAVFALGIVWRIALAWLLGLCEGDVWIAVTTGLAPFFVKTVIEVFLAAALVNVVRGRRGGPRGRPQA
ncbi:MAG: biotin transporter BioY [Phycisphaerae bacterium]